ncbi:ABC transporter permease subunit [Rhodocaloribacter litoris]|uniref:ABC transporter permease/substrate-binding protein n=1 Tax=Rhodocaloribacter litoris TaxID=2558931 RepID=UPI0014248510|nr:glycine betaine ABC transporter substrate-binding protein [Rhodocaloribacter litoris]QXD14732.1 ABC transporter permease subunit [Rhodocaloribacter litoris]
MKAGPALVLLVLAHSLMPAPVRGQPETVHIGSKVFTENVILAEIAGHLARQAGHPVVMHTQLGGTRLLWNALRSGEIDVYPEYTGTILQEILAGRDVSAGALADTLAALGVRMTPPLGFNNTYALGMRRARARNLGIRTISDLRAHPRLRFGFSNEFMDRADGWPALRDRYGLPQTDVRGLDHDLAYRGIASGALDVIDLYTTDAEIAHYDLLPLEDDLHHFPDYQAVYLYRDDLARRTPDFIRLLERLAGALPESTMVRMNASVRLDGRSEARVAADFVNTVLASGEVVRVARETRWTRLWRHTREHLLLVAVSLLAAVLVAIPLGIAAAKFPRLGQGILAVVGIIYTIPSLALLVFMIPLLGIGGVPAMVALFLYSLLPIVRNTHAGLNDIPVPLIESAHALGLTPAARLRHVELPLAARSILAGIKTAAVINVGTATLGALIGAGGYGQPILTGIRLDDVGLILEGAIPAALLALAVQGLFDLVERRLTPPDLH